MNQNPIELTIQAVELKIATLSALAENLRAFAGQSAPIAEPLPIFPVRAKPSNGRVLTPPAGPVRVRKIGGDALRILGIAAKLPVPFDNPALMAAAGIPKSSAGSSINRWVTRGWLQRVSLGQYTRTPSFGNANGKPDRTTPSAAPKSIARAPAPVIPLALSARLDAALKQRDAARASGRDTVAAMFQESVDQIRAEIEGNL